MDCTAKSKSKWIFAGPPQPSPSKFPCVSRMRALQQLAPPSTPMNSWLDIIWSLRKVAAQTVGQEQTKDGHNKVIARLKMRLRGVMARPLRKIPFAPRPTLPRRKSFVDRLLPYLRDTLGRVCRACLQTQ